MDNILSHKVSLNKYKMIKKLWNVPLYYRIKLDINCKSYLESCPDI